MNLFQLLVVLFFLVKGTFGYHSTPQWLAFHQLYSWVPSFEAVRLQAKEEGEGESKGEGES